MLIVESAPLKKGNKIIREMGIKHMELRTRKEWIGLFDSKGVRFVKSQGITLVGHYLVRLSSRFIKNRLIKKFMARLSEQMDIHLIGPLDRFAKPTIFKFIN